MGEMFAKALTMGGTGLGLARQLLGTMNAATGSAAQPAAGRPRAESIPVRPERR
ncbi:hypothetical protein GCM10020229_57040 [Kitasatospora albolonga]